MLSPTVLGVFAGSILSPFLPGTGAGAGAGTGAGTGAGSGSGSGAGSGAGGSGIVRGADDGGGDSAYLTYSERSEEEGDWDFARRADSEYEQLYAELARKVSGLDLYLPSYFSSRTIP
jgi:hypothetical protein